jgi:hypothetical protein
MKMKAIGNELANPYVDNNVDDFILRINEIKLEEISKENKDKD